MMKKLFVLVLFAVLLVTLAACAPDSKVSLNKPDTEIQFTPPGTNPELDKPTEAGIVAGLGTGLWHGFISPVTLIISFFNPAIQMYEVHNTGSLYNLGFLFGVAIVFLVLGFSGGRRRCTLNLQTHVSGGDFGKIPALRILRMTRPKCVRSWFAGLGPAAGYFCIGGWSGRELK